MEEAPASNQEASTRHMQTEKRRRDRIASGFEALRELVPCKDRKMDKATFLQEVVEYVAQLQSTVQQAVLRGGLYSLPEETQWQVRLLLPREPEQGAAHGMTLPPQAAAYLQPPAAPEMVAEHLRAATAHFPPSSTVPAGPPPASEGRAAAPDQRQQQQAVAATEQAGPDTQMASAEAREPGSAALAAPSAIAQPAVAASGGQMAAVQPNGSESWQELLSRSMGVQDVRAFMAEGGSSADGQKRIGQLQHMIRQLQSQQAMSAQQLQLQQAALMQSQVYNPFRVQQAAQQNAPQQGPTAVAEQEPGAEVRHVAEEAASAPEQQAEPAEEQPEAGAVDKAVRKPPRRNMKVRRHTTAAKSSNPHSSGSSTSEEAAADNGRPEIPADESTP